MAVKILTGNCLEVLKTLPDQSVQCCVTSPPYYGLRSYGMGIENGEIGLELTPEEFLENLVAVFRQVKRVLRDDGVIFVNLGDSYASAWGCGRRNVVGNGSMPNGKREHRQNRLVGDLKEKDLIGIPWMAAFALRADGWYLRSDIIWAKGCSGDYKGGNVMPESVKDRPTRAHEYLFLLSKSEKYFYDHCAIKEEIQEACIARITQKNFSNQTGGDKDYGKTGVNTSRSMRKTLENWAESQNGERNIRDVWTIKTKGYSGAHFATFPEKLVEPCIMAGTSQAGCCSECGKPYQRIIEKQGITAHDGTTDSAYEKKSTSGRLALLRQAARERGEEYSNKTTTLGWQPDCACNAKAVPCVVLDPFGGSGTVGAVAERLGRNSILIELNPEYVKLAEQRTAQTGLLLEVA